MSDITLYHNPNCSKSRATLALLQDYQRTHDTTIEIVEYLKTPLSVAQLSELVDQLGTSTHDLLRPKESAYREHGLSVDSTPAELLAAVAAAPILMERPVVVCQGKAAIGRPPEQVLAVLPQD